MADDQQPAGLQAALEISNCARKIFEPDQMIAPAHATLAETAMAQHGHGEDRIVGA